MINLHVSVREICLLTLFFTGLALYFDIHNKHHILLFIINHIIALLLALILSKIIYEILSYAKYW
jgi:hypothetical protein